MNDIIKIVQALKNSNILIKGVTKTIKNETKERKGGFFSMLLDTLGASLLRNLLAGKGILKAGSGNKKRNCKCWYWKRIGFLIPSHPLTNLETQKYYKNQPRFNGDFSRNNLPEYNSIKNIKDGAYIINLDEYSDVDTHWIALFCKKNEVLYFNSFGVEYIPEEFKEFPGNKNI